jgi:hypothetical protein
MPQICATCQHPRRDEIDRALASGRAHRQLASEFGLSRGSLDRHAASHLPALLAEAQVSQRVLTAQDLLGRIHALSDEAEAVLAAAKRNGDYQLTLSAIDRSRGVLGLLGRVLADARALAQQEQTDGHDSRTCPYLLPHKRTCPDAIAHDRMVQSMVSALDSTRAIPPPEPDDVYDNRFELELGGLNPDQYTPEDLPENERAAFEHIATEVTHSPLYQSNPTIPSGGRSWRAGQWA